MDREEVQALLEGRRLPGGHGDTALIETHISWVLLNDDFAYKFKRPVVFSFLDYSTMEKRRLCCLKEVELNRRLAEEVYLGVLPVTRGMVTGDPGDPTIAGHAVQMKRMDNALEMDALLARKEVGGSGVDALAAKISRFHRRAAVVEEPFDPRGLGEDYADILRHREQVERLLGKDALSTVEACVREALAYLDRNRSYLEKRVDRGLRRHGHGDLNARNIFLYDDPVIFDCIEFNDAFRRVDVFADIAFLCVDLDFFGEPGLARRFHARYVEFSGFADDPSSRSLLHYYMSYRANIRAKVSLISARQEGHRVDTADIASYVELMARNMAEFRHSRPR
jgi:hypothetical protein